MQSILDKMGADAKERLERLEHLSSDCFIQSVPPMVEDKKTKLSENKEKEIFGGADLYRSELKTFDQKALSANRLKEKTLEEEGWKGLNLVGLEDDEPDAEDEDDFDMGWDVEDLRDLFEQALYSGRESVWRRAGRLVAINALNSNHPVFHASSLMQTFFTRKIPVPDSALSIIFLQIDRQKKNNPTGYDWGAKNGTIDLAWAWKRIELGASRYTGFEPQY